MPLSADEMRPSGHAGGMLGIALVDRVRSDPDRRRALAHGVLVGAWVGALLIATEAAVYYTSAGGVGMDAHAYWLAGGSAHPYQAAPEQMDAFLYSPAFAQIMRPLAALPWHAFMALWMTTELACFLWLTKGLRWTWRIPALLLAVPELLIGNIYGFLGVAIVVGVTRRPETWAFALFTKVTTALPGVLWFAARREWRSLGRLLVGSGLVAAVSFAISPGLWSEWLEFLVRHGSDQGYGPLLRLGLALAVALVAARRGWAFLLPLAVLLAVPTWSGENKDFALLLAAIPLALRDTTPRALRDQRADQSVNARQESLNSAAQLSRIPAIGSTSLRANLPMSGHKGSQHEGRRRMPPLRGRG
jgi:Glycosyltransferase family 87